MVDDLAARYDVAADSYDEIRGGERRARAVAVEVARLSPASGLLVDVAGGTGSVARADARRLPLPDASVAVVTTIWLLHLLPVTDADAVLAEAARVLADDGVLVTTVDKDLAHRADRRTDADAADRVTGRCALLGLVPSGSGRVHGETRWHQTGVGWRVEAFRKVAT